MYLNCRKHRAGFTLVEILAVVVIIGIASAIIIPQIGTRDDMRAAAAARVIVSDLIYAQNMAISNGTVVYVKFDTGNNRYTLLSTANSGGDVAMTNPITQTTYTQQFGATSRGWETITLTSAVFNGIDNAYRPMYTLGFDEIGSPYAFSYSTNDKNDLNDGTIVVTCGQFSKTITISAATGEITVN
jgi:prepilin-type N-terminal cleavage/methylation domain-containing protein